MVVQDYLRSPSSGIAFLNDAKVIPLIGEQLFKNEPLVNGSGDFQWLGAQEYARKDVVRILLHSGAFIEDVRDWAERLRPNMVIDDVSEVDPSVTDLLRRWYRANEAALKAWDFKTVQTDQ
jgi:hypothetical protein